jgi:hypothetical protein
MGINVTLPMLRGSLEPECLPGLEISYPRYLLELSKKFNRQDSVSGSSETCKSEEVDKDLLLNGTKGDDCDNGVENVNESSVKRECYT